MATVSRKLTEYSNETGPVCTIYVEYDDSTMRISGVRVINNSTLFCYAAVIRDSDQLLYAQTFPPGETFVPVPTNGQNRIDFIDDGQGHWRGVSFMSRYPA